MIDLTVDTARRERAIRTAREREIVIPTYEQMRRPETAPALIKEKLRTELRRFLRKRSGRRPLVLPVIMEI